MDSVIAAVTINDLSERVMQARRLIKEAIEQLSPPAYYGSDSWWERSEDFLEETEVVEQILEKQKCMAACDHEMVFDHNINVDERRTIFVERCKKDCGFKQIRR